MTDNPVVFPDEDSAISGGNFHAQPVAFAADTIAMALCEVGSLSERRTAVAPVVAALWSVPTADPQPNGARPASQPLGKSTDNTAAPLDLFQDMRPNVRGLFGGGT